MAKRRNDPPLYVDDDLIGREFIARLRAEGFDVETSQEAGLLGVSDPKHFAHAIKNRRVLITRNAKDYVPLHELVNELRISHPGLLFVRSDNDAKRDMTPAAIVDALTNLFRQVKSGTPLENQIHELNRYR